MRQSEVEGRVVLARSCQTGCFFSVHLTGKFMLSMQSLSVTPSPSPSHPPFLLLLPLSPSHSLSYFHFPVSFSLKEKGTESRLANPLQKQISNWAIRYQFLHFAPVFVSGFYATLHKIKSINYFIHLLYLRERIELLKFPMNDVQLNHGFIDSFHFLSVYKGLKGGSDKEWLKVAKLIWYLPQKIICGSDPQIFKAFKKFVVIFSSDITNLQKI